MTDMQTIFQKGKISINKFSKIEDLENSWKTLQSNSSLYLTFESVKSYVDNVVGNQILIFTLSENDIVKAIFPFRYKKSIFYTTYYIISYNFGFNLEPIWKDLNKKLKKLFIKEIIKYLAKKNSIIYLDPITKEFSKNIKITTNELKVKQDKSKEHLYRITLKKSWEEFLSSLSRKFRKNLRYYQKKTTSNFKIGFEKNRKIQNFFKLHTLYMRDKHDLSILEFKKFQNYYKNMFSLYPNSGLFNLKLNNKIVASLAYIDFNKIRYFLNIGISPEYKKYSVGRILIAHAIKNSINNRMDFFDFGKGDDQYKLDWGCEVFENDKILIYSHKFYYLIFEITSFIYNTIKRLGIKLLRINIIKNIILKGE